MKTSTIKLIAAFAAVCLLSANVALAKNGGNGNGGNKGGNGGNKFSAAKQNGGGNNTALKLGLAGLGVALNNGNNGNGNGNGNCNNNGNGNNNGNCNNNGNNNNCDGNGGPITDNFVNLGRAFEPFHSSYVVQPGDSFFEVALKEYGSSTPARFIAQFNRMPQNSALVLGQALQLPSISSTGRLSFSRAPVAESLQGTAEGTPVANFGTTSGLASTKFASSKTPVTEAPRPKVTVGSTLLVDGQTFGEKPGVARLRVGGLSLPIEVVEWTTTSVKIHLPTVELTSATKADIEVVRADGTVASKTGIELGAATEVALTK